MRFVYWLRAFRRGSLLPLEQSLPSPWPNPIPSCSPPTEVNGEFFQHVHAQESNVYDFSDWVSKHPGGPDKIRQWTERGYILNYPASHPTTRWESDFARTAINPGFVGRLGDTVSFLTLPQSLQTFPLATAFGALESFNGFAEVCGSPGEVANDLSSGHRYAFHTEGELLDTAGRRGRPFIPLPPLPFFPSFFFSPLPFCFTPNSSETQQSGPIPSSSNSCYGEAFDVAYDTPEAMGELGRASIWTMISLKAQGEKKGHKPQKRQKQRNS